jgi:hypothetical protein
MIKSWSRTHDPHSIKTSCTELMRRHLHRRASPASKWSKASWAKLRRKRASTSKQPSFLSVRPKRLCSVTLCKGHCGNKIKLTCRMDTTDTKAKKDILIWPRLSLRSTNANSKTISSYPKKCMLISCPIDSRRRPSNLHSLICNSAKRPAGKAVLNAFRRWIKWSWKVWNARLNKLYRMATSKLNSDLAKETRDFNPTTLT